MITIKNLQKFSIFTLFFIIIILNLNVSSAHAIGTLSSPILDGWKNTDDMSTNGSAVEYGGLRIGNTVWCKPNDILGVTVWGKQYYDGDWTQIIGHSYISFGGTDTFTKYWLPQPTSNNPPPSIVPWYTDASSDDIAIQSVNRGNSTEASEYLRIGGLFWTQFFQDNRNYSIRNNEYSLNGNWMLPEDKTGIGTSNYWAISTETISTDGDAPTIGVSPNSSSWGNKNVNVGINVNDTRSGIQKYRYAYNKDNSGWQYSDWILPSIHSDFDGSAFTHTTNGTLGSSPEQLASSTANMSSNLNLSGQGTYQVQVQASDNLGNARTYTSGTYLIDTTAPTGVFTPNSQNWTNTNVTTSFNPSDSGGSGVSKWRYKTSSDNGTTWGAWSSYTTGDTAGNITLSGQGQWKVQSEITDVAGNVGTSTSGTYQIDITAPTGVFMPNSQNWNNGNDTTLFRPSDSGGSGVNKWRYKTSSDNGTTWGAWSGYTTGGTAGYITLIGQGQWKVQSEITDVAGNVGTSTSGTYQIDITAPTGIFTPNSQSWTDTNVTTSFNPSDSGGSGVSKWRYKTSSDNGTTWGAWSSYTTGDTAGNITLSGQGQWKVQSEITDVAGNVGTSTSGTYLIDTTAPTGVFTPNSQNWTNTNVTTSFNPSDSGGSGVSKWRYKTSSDNGTTWGAWSSYTTGDTAGNITLNGQGQWKVQSEITDVAGNVGTSTSGVFQIFNPVPNNNSLNVTQFDYEQDSNNYWVKPGSVIGVYTDGYFTSAYGIYPSRTYLALAKDGILTSNTSVQYADLNNHYNSGSEYSSNFNFLNNGDKASDSVASGNNYISTTHHMQAKNDGSSYKLYYKTSFIDSSNNEYLQNYADSGKWIKVDGIAPGFDSVADYNNDAVDRNVSTVLNLDKNLNLSGTVANLFDKGSGIKNVYAKLYPTGKEGAAKVINLTNVNGEWTLPTTDAYALFKSADLNVDIYTQDNVGNIGKIQSQKFNLLSVSAQIVPYDTPTFTGTPTLEAGQKAILKIYTTGYADKLNITFPPELSAIDSSLNRTMNINPQATSETDVVFNVPRKISEKQYTVDVIATNSAINKNSSTTADFIVTGDIFEGLRTTILDDN
ncbi:hypothetical protein [Clostridium akagii]|uniref:hypothetical protein n=1 Tax=Clostridium akagii TaxID=91623 RepID=UPI000689BA1A|nr:hypothetical protein [Clostridium akagii]